MTSTPTKDEGAGVPPAAKSSWSQFLKTITSFNGDLASLTAPPFILSSTSLTEYSSYWAEHPDLFVAPALDSSPQQRALHVLKWFLSTLKQQYSSRNEKLGSEKKPLNPFLGELFLGHWDHPTAGRTELISEQVSHHPPVTAYAIINAQHGVKLEGYNGQKASFARGTINVRQVGHAMLHLEKWDEHYLIQLPSLHIEGIIYGAPYVELNKSCTIVSSSGYVAKIDFSGKGWISGKKNSFTATLTKEGAKEVLYSIDGQWTGNFEIKEGKGKNVLESYNAKTNMTTPLAIAPLDSQDPLESRRAWSKVQAAIQAGDMDTTGVEKSKIENEQRELRKKEKEEGREWERRFFTRVEENKLFKTLAERVGIEPEPEKTDGVWIFDEAKAAKWGYGKKKEEAEKEAVLEN
ncbi:Oxysterol-binding protein [Ascodesmis nigricans]|uniref:Oxysterol-binding protein n=1 Tax=Ascodesmis nigricans TaxID=341454 RepID=A0A4V3SIU4_9PEZI|nr:Oxysterol-binding protein [Ascodesmis nigricans]